METRPVGGQAQMQHERCRSVCVIDPVGDPRWPKLVSLNSDGGIFHHPAWLALLRDYYKFKTFAVCIEQEGDIVSGIPFCEIEGWGLGRMKLVCLPFSDHCAPLAASPPDVKHLLEGAMDRAASLRARLEVHHRLEDNCGWETSRNYCLHVSDLEHEPERLMKQLKSRTQRCIKKAQKNELKTEIRRDREAVNIFYRLHLKTRKKQGVPIQPRGFFDLLHRYMIEGNLGFVSLTGSGTRYMSAGMFFGFKRTVTYKYGASDPDCLDVSPNHLMFWDTMLYAKQEGFSKFDFGRTELANVGLRYFKSGWNSKEAELPYSYFPAAPSARFLDLVRKKVMEPAIRHSPAIVCRMAGEALYRRFGA